jgi:type IV pilus assembly protein PilM
VAIGLDIGSSAVRVTELEQRRGGTPRLTRYGSVPLPSGAVVDGDVVEPTVVSDALRELWGVAGVRGRKVAVGLGSQKVTVRQIELPELADAELSDAVRLQAQDQLPMPVDQALLDHVVVDRYTVGDGRRNVRVLLVAAEREMVERLLAPVAAARLRPVLVDLDAFALLRSLATPRLMSDDVELVVDVGATVTKIALHRGGGPRFVRMVRLGGDGSTRALQKLLELSWEEAEKAKLDASLAMAAGADLDPDDERARVLQNSVQGVITEVRRSLDFFRGQDEDVEVQRLLLSGGASLTPHLAEQLQGALELPVERGDPLRTIEAAYGGREPFDPREQAPFLAVPVGLALGVLQ